MDDNPKVPIRIRPGKVHTHKGVRYTENMVFEADARTAAWIVSTRSADFVNPNDRPADLRAAPIRMSAGVRVAKCCGRK